MRTSSREAILSAALRVVDVEGGEELTYDSVAREAGLTKAGVMYHFPSKEDMMIAVIEHVITRWQNELLEELGVPFAESTLEQRVRAFVTFATGGGVSRGEFAVFSGAVRRPVLSEPWHRYLREWFSFGESTDTAPLMLAWFAANGVWIAESTGILQVNPEQRAELLDRMIRLTVGGDR